MLKYLKSPVAFINTFLDLELSQISINLHKIVYYISHLSVIGHKIKIIISI